MNAHEATAARWINDNPHGWTRLLAFATADAELGQQVRVKHYVEQLRKEPDIKGIPYRVPNNATAPLAALVADTFIAQGKPEWAALVRRVRRVGS